MDSAKEDKTRCGSRVVPSYLNTKHAEIRPELASIQVAEALAAVVVDLNPKNPQT